MARPRGPNQRSRIPLPLVSLPPRTPNTEHGPPDTIFSASPRPSTRDPRPSSSPNTKHRTPNTVPPPSPSRPSTPDPRPFFAPSTLKMRAPPEKAGPDLGNLEKKLSAHGKSWTYVEEIRQRRAARHRGTEHTEKNAKRRSSSTDSADGHRWEDPEARISDRESRSLSCLFHPEHLTPNTQHRSSAPNTEHRTPNTVPPPPTPNTVPPPPRPSTPDPRPSFSPPPLKCERSPKRQAPVSRMLKKTSRPTGNSGLTPQSAILRPLTPNTEHPTPFLLPLDPRPPTLDPSSPLHPYNAKLPGDSPVTPELTAPSAARSVESRPCCAATGRRKIFFSGALVPLCAGPSPAQPHPPQFSVRSVPPW